jgi:hypothetical protein
MLIEIEHKREMYQKVLSVKGYVNPYRLKEDYIEIIRAENLSTPNIEKLANKIVKTSPIDRFVFADCFIRKEIIA